MCDLTTGFPLNLVAARKPMSQGLSPRGQAGPSPALVLSAAPLLRTARPAAALPCQSLWFLCRLTGTLGCGWIIDQTHPGFTGLNTTFCKVSFPHNTLKSRKIWAMLHLGVCCLISLELWNDASGFQIFLLCFAYCSDTNAFNKTFSHIKKGFTF